MDIFFVTVYIILGIYYAIGILTYVYIYSVNHNKNRVYINAESFSRENESDLDSILEHFENNNENNLSYAGY